jgi:hypothetical protein
MGHSKAEKAKTHKRIVVVGHVPAQPPVQFWEMAVNRLRHYRPPIDPESRAMWKSFQ